MGNSESSSGSSVYGNNRSDVRDILFSNYNVAIDTVENAHGRLVQLTDHAKEYINFILYDYKRYNKFQKKFGGYSTTSLDLNAIDKIEQYVSFESKIKSKSHAELNATWQEIVDEQRGPRVVPFAPAQKLPATAVDNAVRAYGAQQAYLPLIGADENIAVPAVLVRLYSKGKMIDGALALPVCHPVTAEPMFVPNTYGSAPETYERRRRHHNKRNHSIKTPGGESQSDDKVIKPDSGPSGNLHQMGHPKDEDAAKQREPEAIAAQRAVDVVSPSLKARSQSPQPASPSIANADTDTAKPPDSPPNESSAAALTESTTFGHDGRLHVQSPLPAEPVHADVCSDTLLSLAGKSSNHTIFGLSHPDRAVEASDICFFKAPASENFSLLCVNFYDAFSALSTAMHSENGVQEITASNVNGLYAHLQESLRFSAEQNLSSLDKLVSSRIIPVTRDFVYKTLQERLQTDGSGYVPFYMTFDQNAWSLKTLPLNDTRGIDVLVKDAM